MHTSQAQGSAQSTPRLRAHVRAGGTSTPKGKGAENPDVNHCRINNVFELAKEEHLRGRPDVFELANPSLRKKVAYVVFRGRKVGMFETWPAAAKQIDDLPGGKTGRVQGFYTHEAALQAWKHAVANDLVTMVEDPPSSPSRCHPRFTSPSFQRPAFTRSQEPPTPFDWDDGLGHPNSPPSLPSESPPPSPRRRRAPASSKQPACQETRQSTSTHRQAQSYQTPASTKRTPLAPVSDDEDMYLSDLSHDESKAPPSVSAHHPNKSASTRLKTAHTSILLSPRMGPSLATLSAPMEMTDEDCYWVVTQGALPGVYQGRAAANAAVGDHQSPSIFRTTDLAAATMIFTRSYMAGEVSRY